MTGSADHGVDAGVQPESAQAALEKVLASPHFSNSRRLSEFLRCSGSRAIAGEAAGLDELLIARQIYGRDPDYDPRVDSIVRVEANRLRAKLRAYYEAEGGRDPVRIRLPQDSYIPVFEAAPEPAPPGAARKRPLLLTLAVALAAVTTMAALVPFTRLANNQRRTIAVLPFSTSGGVADKDYFSSGLTERISDQLERSRALDVVASRSSRQFTDVSDARQVGRKLHADLVLEGGVRFSEDKIGVSTRLYDAHSGRRIWSQEFNRASDEVRGLQDEVSGAVAAALHLGSGNPAAQRATAGWTNDSTALDLYLRARYLFDSRKLDSLWKSIDLYDDALKRDPKFAMAYAGVAEDYVVLATNEDQDMPQMTALARQAVAHALAIDPNLPEALLTKAATTDLSNFAGVERAYRAAIAANPSSANAHHWWGVNLLAAGRFAEAESEIRQAQALDPLSLYIGAHVGTVYYCSRRYQDAIDWERKLLELDPHLNRAPVILARSYEALGRYTEAADILERLPKTNAVASVMADLGHVYAVSGKKEKASQVMAELTRMAKTRHVSPQYMALVQTGLGNKSAALALLEMSYEQHEAPLALLKVDPRWDPLRGDPRFLQLLHQLNLDK